MFKTKLKSRRESLGLTQRQLAMRCKVLPCVISFYETGRRVPKTATLRKLAKALRCGMEELL
jgi:hypothetical protein